MGFVDELDKRVKQMRESSFLNSPQMCIGDVLNLIEDIPDMYGDQPVSVQFDFGTAFPSDLSSWRGAYSELALNYDLCGYDDFGRSDVMWKHTDLADFRQMLKDAIGKSYEGWKGGDYIMTINTPLWVANDGNVGNTGVVGVLNKNYTVIIQTAYCEY